MKNMIKQVKYMRDNRPELFQQFLFGVTMSILSFFQIVSVILVYVLL